MHPSVHSSTVYNSQDMETTGCPLTEEWVEKLWSRYAMEYYSATKKDQNGAICRDVDRPRDCHTERSKLEREEQIPSVNSYMWNLGKWFKEPMCKAEIETQT